MAKIVISSDGTWHGAEECFLVEFPPSMTGAEIAAYLDDMGDWSRGTFASQNGLPINEL